MLFPGTVLRHCSQTLVNQAMQRNQSQQHTQAKAYEVLHLYLLSSQPYTRIGSTIIYTTCFLPNMYTTLHGLVDVI